MSTLIAKYNVGDVVEDFSLPLLDGTTVKLSNFQGKILLLVFTTTWCPYCGAEAPYLEKEIWQKYKDKDVQVLAIDVKESIQIAKQFRDQYGLTFPFAVDETGEVALQFAPIKEGLPPDVAVINSHYILDKTGKIIYREFFNMEKFDLRASAVIQELDKILAQG